jgi:hypothetical protein
LDQDIQNLTFRIHGDIDATLGQQILDIPKAQRPTDATKKPRPREIKMTSNMGELLAIKKADRPRAREITMMSSMNALL